MLNTKRDCIMGSTCDGFLQRIRQHGTEISVCLCVDFRLESCILLPNGMHTTSMLFKIEITKKYSCSVRMWELRPNTHKKTTKSTQAERETQWQFYDHHAVIILFVVFGWKTTFFWQVSLMRALRVVFLWHSAWLCVVYFVKNEMFAFLCSHSSFSPCVFIYAFYIDINFI